MSIHLQAEVFDPNTTIKLSVRRNFKMTDFFND